jgi:hypothetical protein
MQDSWAGFWTSGVMVGILTCGFIREIRRRWEVKAMDVYALSWATSRKPAGNVVETAQRKSQTFCIKDR